MTSTARSGTGNDGSRKGCVLVVEDDADIRDIVSEVLQDAGYDVATASNGREGLDVLARGATPQLILLDLMMPVLDGLGFVAEQSKLAPEIASIPVVFFSASGRVPTVDPENVLRKPADTAKLLEMVERHCAAAPGG